MTEPIDRARMEALAKEISQNHAFGMDCAPYAEEYASALRVLFAWADEARDVVAEYREEVIACGWAREYADELAALLARWPAKERQ